MKVLIADKAAPEGIEKLKAAGFEVDVKTGCTEDQLLAIIGDYDGMMVRSETKVTAKIIDAAKKMKIIGRAGVGVDNIDVPAATKKGIIVVNSPDGNTIAAAEHTFAMMMALSRNIPQAVASLKGKKWEKSKFMGSELYNKILGIVGIGKIGSRVAAYAQGLGMKVICYDPFINEDYAKKIGVTVKSLDEVLKESDYITLHLPKTKDTAKMINKDKIALMKDGVKIINVARGGIIDEADLKEALLSKKIAAAALDVFEVEPAPDNPLIELENVIATPHLGASTVEAQVNVAVDVAEQIADVLKGGMARAAVNIPSMRPDILGPVKHFLPIAEKLGSFAAQIVSGPVTSVEISYLGELSNNNITPLTTAVLKGILGYALGESVNHVNASLIAKERGISVKEVKSGDAENFSNLISITVVSGSDKKTVAGTVLGSFGERLVRIDDLQTDVVPTGFLLITEHTDKPGIIGKVGTLLGENNINIASMDVGRKSIGGKAVMILNIDTPASDDMLKKIKKIEGISNALVVKI
ncbi:MAG: phosphoglycerate dehydrogenase [Candidatus Saganbacteria bacterium]|nr:phosphoglycerate dehydrogenase [Candidatus Saganbacteria bacterium]